MSRAEILEDTLARLEVERYAPSPRKQEPEDPGPPRDLTPEEQAHNRDTLLAAVTSYQEQVAREARP